MKRFLLRSTAMFAPPGEGGSGGGSGDGGGQQQQQQQQGSGDGSPAGGGGQPQDKGGGQQQQQAAPYRPQGLPDHLAGKDDKETIEKLFGAVNGFRQSQGERGTVPKDAASYQFEWNDKVRPYTAEFDKDPVFAKTRDIFHAAGVTDKQAQQIIGPWIEALIDGNMLDKPVDGVAQLLTLVPPEAVSLDDNGKKAAASKRVTTNLAWIDTAKEQGVFPTVDDGKGGKSSPIADFFSAALASDPRAHQAIEWLRGQGEQPKPAFNGSAPAGGMSKEALNARINDPRNDPRSSKFEPAFAEETDRLTRELHPG